MPYDRNSSYDPPFATGTRFWNPSEVLLKGRLGRCSGVTKAGLPCKNYINASDTSYAQEILYELEHCDPRHGISRELLADLADVTLCVRWHRDRIPQGPEVVKGWGSDVRRYNRAMEPSQHSRDGRAALISPPTRPLVERHGRRAHELAISDSARSQSLDEARQAVSVDGHSSRRYRRESAGRDAPTTVTPDRQPTSSTPTPTISRSDERPDSMAASHRRIADRDRAPASPDISQSSSPRSSELHEHVSQANGTRQAERSSQAAATFRTTNVSSSSPLDEASATVDPPASTSPQSPSVTGTRHRQPPPISIEMSPEMVRPYVPRRQPLDDCSICLETFNSTRAALHIVHCRAQCGHNFHEACMMEWAEHQTMSAEGTRSPERTLAAVKCPYCRSTWEWEDVDARLL